MSTTSEMIHGAAESLLGSAYTIDDPEVCRELSSASLRGLTACLTIDNSQQISASSSTQNALVVDMIRAGVRIRVAAGSGGRFTCHQKTMVVDGKIAYFGSGNFTHNSRLKCFEFGCKTDDPRIVSKLTERLEWLYANARVLTLEDAEEHLRKKEESRARRARTPSPAR